MSCSETVEKANRKFHDCVADQYDNMLCRRGDPAYASFMERINDLIPKETYLLDVGTGTGKVLDLVALNYTAIGIDISFGMLRAACSSQVAQASCFLLPFADCTFKGVTAYSLLHHLYKIEPLFHEVYRVLKSGSWLITDNDSNALFHEWFGWWLWLRKLFKRSTMSFSKDVKTLYALSEYHHLNGLDANVIEAALYEAGFKSVLVEYCHPPIPDWFTRILIWLEIIIPKTVCRYYLRICARKP